MNRATVPLGLAVATVVLGLGVTVPSLAQPAAEPAVVELRVEPASVEPGRAGAGSLALVPAAGLRIPPDAPLIVELAPSAPVRAVRARLRRADAADPRADAPRFDLPLIADAAGSFTVGIAARFWVCGRRSCWPVRARADVPVISAVPPAPAAASPADAPAPGAPAVRAP